MKALQQCAVALFVAEVVAHGYVRSINVDGAVTWDRILGVKRIEFEFNANMINVAGRAGVQDVTSRDTACNALPITPPALIAPARAGSDVVFRWTEWLPSHRGPLTTYLAPYNGDVSRVNVTQLEFFKIHEVGLTSENVWATDKMILNNGSWVVTLPWDIKPGPYVLRHELLALHFATEHSNYKIIPGSIVAPQLYISCFNLNITGDGTATPLGVTFPGAYKPNDPGLIFDIFVNQTDYPIPGPKVYQPSGKAPAIQPNPPKLMSQTGNSLTDVLYKNVMEQDLHFFDQINDFIYKMGG